jgi:hypothetical protein
VYFVCRRFFFPTKKPFIEQLTSYWMTLFLIHYFEGFKYITAKENAIKQQESLQDSVVIDRFISVRP